MRLFKDPRGFFEETEAAPLEASTTSSISALLGAAFPEWDKELASPVAVDLDQMRLAQAPALNAMMTTKGTFQSRITPTGARFLRFIEDEN